MGWTEVWEVHGSERILNNLAPPSTASSYSSVASKILPEGNVFHVRAVPTTSEMSRQGSAKNGAGTGRENSRFVTFICTAA